MLYKQTPQTLENIFAAEAKGGEAGKVLVVVQTQYVKGRPNIHADKVIRRSDDLLGVASKKTCPQVNSIYGQGLKVVVHCQAKFEHLLSC